MTPSPWLVAVVVALLAVPVVADLQRRRERRPARLAASLVALAALAALAIRPETRRVSPVGRSLLVTAGADTELVQRLRRTEGPWREVYWVDGADGTVGAVGGRGGRALVGGIGYLANRGTEDTLHVVGEGLRWWEWEQYRGVVVFGRDDGTTGRREKGRGFDNLAWDREVRLGDRAIIAGSVGPLEAADTVRVRLSEMGEVVDSAMLGEDGQFEVWYEPREVGRRVLELSLDAAPDPVGGISRRIGVSVTEPARPNVLILEGSPTFEMRHLKDWLGRRGSHVALRSTISDGRHRSEYVNRSEVALDRVTRALLSQFDLAIVDARTWRMLGAAQQNAIVRAADEEALGVLFVPDAALLDSLAAGRVAGRRGAFAVRPIGDLEVRSVKPQWLGAPNDPLAVLPSFPFEILPAIGQQPVVRDEFGAILVAARTGAGGAFAVNLVSDSYRWLLQGRAEEYGAFWAHTIDAVLGGAARPGWHVAARGPVFADTPVDVVLSGAVEATNPRLQLPDASVAPVALARDRLLPDRWSARFWPTEPGWHMAVANETEAFWFYVNDITDWTDLQHRLATEDTRLRSELNSRDGAARPAETTEPVPPAWFFLAFCLAAGFLWLEPRI